MVTFQEETFEQCFDEAVPLLRRHWLEVARNRESVPLAPNVPAYVTASERGHLCIVTARHAGAMVGYSCDLVAAPFHYSETIFAESDIYWVAPEWRGRSVGMRLMLKREEVLRARQAVIVLTRIKIAHPQAGRLLSHLGHEPIETVYSKVLK